ncbi:cysteine hydrolase [[Clostridium] innocuum]|nr:cysteine hydrolase [Erysipelotrichaceae bacterium]MCR0384757.1 cysteine hydrolase [[Clostridium] innocuum]MCR0412011.1 cysteine hydrolase [[Clostridium] innocuum]MCR0534754.1 cysteine hydrolase [[Clostridium] innocuum]MCR0537632.1 cysteine hydrolase [[Clostridium] innocuum]
MARVSKQFLEAYKPLSTKELKDPVIFVVDMIEGFVHEGALHDEAIHAATMHIESLIQDAEQRVIFIADSHPPKTREFISYPSHCVIGTKESEVIQELQPYVQELMRKNSTNTFTCPDFQLFLKERLKNYRDIVITGCCTDICILQFALCLNAWLNEHNKTEQRIIIPLSCVDTYHIEGVHDAVSCNEFSIRNMEANGICIVSKLERED